VADSLDLNPGWATVFAALATAIATVIVAYRQFKKNGISAEEAQVIIQAAIADMEAKRVILEDRNMAVHMRQIEKERRIEAEEQLQAMHEALHSCKRKYDELRRRTKS
jgi:formylmethanofuran dehydrogenase subunit B